MKRLALYLIPLLLVAGLVFYVIVPRYRASQRPAAPLPPREEVTVTIPEGKTMIEEEESLASFGVASDTLLAITGNPFTSQPFDAHFRNEFPFLDVLSPTSTLEGYLFPETYRVWKDELPRSLVQKQLEEFDQHARTMMEEIEKQGRSLHEIVTLASIVEKEVATDKDRPIVAGIFMNRLRIGMALQSDATVQYVTRSGRDRSTSDDLALDSPYNTYRVTGLPPAPIGNPGAAALQAALHPTKTPYFYFLTDSTGKVYYAKTLEEHGLNRVKAFGR
jgi:UPF0755 protein